MSGVTSSLHTLIGNALLRLPGLAWCWLRGVVLAQAVSRCVAEQGRVVRLPVHILDTIKRIQAVRSSLAGQDGHSGLVTDEEVAQVLRMPASKIAFYERVRRSLTMCAVCETPHHSRACWQTLNSCLRMGRRLLQGTAVSPGTLTEQGVYLQHTLGVDLEWCMQVSMPTKSFDAPISTLSGHKASEPKSDEAWGELVATNTDDIEGFEDNTLLSKMAQDSVIDLLQHDVNQLLNTLQPRERNVSPWRPSASSTLPLLTKALHDAGGCICLSRAAGPCVPCSYKVYLISYPV